ncbi:hypothetical protein AALO_G00110390, partial [Alosa alosa]
GLCAPDLCPDHRDCRPSGELTSVYLALFVAVPSKHFGATACSLTLHCVLFTCVGCGGCCLLYPRVILTSISSG